MGDAHTLCHMEVSARIDPALLDEHGQMHDVSIILMPKDGTPQVFHASIEPKSRAAITKLVLTEPEPNNLRRLRESRGLTQTALAQMVGTQQAQLSHWEKGNYQPMLRNVIRLASALGVKVADLGIVGYGMPSDETPPALQAV